MEYSDSSKKPHIYIIYGPTGVGKTDLTATFCRYTRAEIVNMDMGQLYTKLRIGTAKPDISSQQAPHHLFDYVDEPIDFSCVAYREAVIATIRSIWQRGNTPILVGGSGFYLRALFFLPSIPSSYSDELSFQEPFEVSWDVLNSIDPVRAAQISKGDSYRINRALTIWKSTGILPSLCKPVFCPIAHAKILHITRDRSELYHRIDMRVYRMIQDGWISEVKQLMQHDPWVAFLKKKKLIGYDDLIAYLETSHQDNIEKHIVEKIAQRTRNYAKRQETFWRTFTKDVGSIFQGQSQERAVHCMSLNLTSTDIDLYIKRLLTTGNSE